MENSQRPAMPRERWAIAAVLLLAAAMRLALITHHGLGNNDFITVRVINMDWGEMIQERLSRNHVPLYFLALKAWTGVAGQSETALRLPSVLATVIGVGALWWVGRMMFCAQVGLIAALLGALHQQWLVACFDVRMYGLAMATVLLAVGAGWQWFETRRASWAAAYFFLMLVGLGTHLLLLTAPASLLIAWLVARRGGWPGRWWTTAAVLFAPVIAAMPLMWLWFQVQYKVGGDPAEIPSAGRLLRNVLVIAFGDYDVFPGDLKDLVRAVTFPLLILTVAGLALHLLRRRWRGEEITDRPRRGLTTLAWIGGLPVLGIYLASITSSSTNTSSRYLCVAGAVAPLIIAAVWWAMPRPWMRRAGIGLSLAAIALQSGVFMLGQGPGVREGMEFLTREAGPGRAAVANCASSTRRAFVFYEVPMAMTRLEREVEDPEAIWAACRQALGDRGERVYLFLYRSKGSATPALLRYRTPWLEFGGLERFGESTVMWFDVVAPD